MSKIVAFANMKGGVGKSTLAISMAEASAYEGKRVILIDLDLQINASMTLAGDTLDDLLPWRRAQTIEQYLEARLRGTVHNTMTFVEQSGLVDLLSGSPTITFFEYRMLTNNGPLHASRNIINSWIWDIFSDLRTNYDLIVCDCPPGLSLLTESTLRTADLVVVPQVPDRLSTQGLQLYTKYMSEYIGIANIASRTAVFINRIDYSTSVARDYIEDICRDAGDPSFPYRVFQNRYSDRVAFKRAMERSRRLSFPEIYADVEQDVLAATRELWHFLLRHNDEARP